MDQPVYFFTSCTRGDSWPSITRFHADLEYRLRVQDGSWVSGALSESASAAPGDDWRSAAYDGIAQAGCMIALWSQDYFLSKWCGLEWSAFRSRIQHHELIKGARAANCLIPLMWKPVPPGALPTQATDVRFATAELGAAYAERGVLSLMQSGDPADEDAYFSLINRLAAYVIEAREVALTPSGPRDFDHLEPAFGTHPDLPGPARIPVPRQGGESVPGSVPRPAPAPRKAPPDASRTPVAISYVGPDQAWADWIDDVLQSAGHPVRQVRWVTSRHSLAETVAEARAAADRVIVLFSRSYFESGDTHPTEWESAFADADEGDPWLVPVQIDLEPRPLLVRRRRRSS